MSAQLFLDSIAIWVDSRHSEVNASFGESEAATFDSMKSENGAMDKHLIIENAVFYRVFFGVDDPTCTFFHRIYYRVICILFCDKV